MNMRQSQQRKRTLKGIHFLMLAEKSVLWLCGKLLNFNYKLFGGEIQEMGWYQTSGQRQTGTGATFLVISFQPTFKQNKVSIWFSSWRNICYVIRLHSVKMI